MQSFLNLTSSTSTITGLNKEKQRILTFSEWNCSSTDKLLLAQIGFYYIGPGDLVKCYFCNLEIGTWQTGDNPVNEHLKWSQNCPLIKGHETNNEPILNKEEIYNQQVCQHD
uniref:CSON003745 protein n=1 Tax=Culicoides sonorensis TaxID=179676 RepID=A0A336MP37_CULSO